MNEKLLLELNHWASDVARISPAHFACRFYDRCNASLKHELDNGKYVQMSYIGKYYPEPSDNLNFRLVIAGIDHGEKETSDYDACRTGIEASYQDGGKKFNPHYRGIIRTAVEIFGDTADYCRLHCVEKCAGGNDGAQATACVLNRSAMPNVVKCVGGKQENRTSQSTWTMWENCSHHLLDELKLLKPNLVVFFGSWARDVILRDYGKGPQLKALPVALPNLKTHYQALYLWPETGCHLLFLHHPSRGHLQRQWDGLVVPALTYLREQGHIPPRPVSDSPC